MHLTHAIILCSLVATSFARPRQDQVTDINRLDEPLSDPELRRTLLRVFAESLKAAADAGIQAAKKSDSGTADLKPPTADAASSEGFDRETSADELLVLSGDSTTSERTLVANPRAASTETPFLVRLDNEEPAESRSAEAAATTERTVSDDPGLSSPAPSPAPPQPTVTVDNLANLTPADSADVNRFISAVSTTPDEKLGAGVEFLQAPLIAAFGLLQEESTGKTRNLVAYPVPQGVSEQLLRDERLTLSVAGQVAGRQGITFSHQPTPDASLVNFQRSLPLQQQPFQEQNFFSSSDDALRRLEKRQQLLQEQLVSLQREREALQRNFRQTRSEVLVPAESNNVFISRSLPIYLQPPFF
ncbi:uncharacterized protein LOC132203158 isoform X2 [Neocloeon triangulifer]|uniref:uncharacterized protein LOC132203158 isoform X2 n=1 Tax=Neocloeon triangulifer TaxID=2078957 RepID=UPI00286F3A08|nr:uncharacterized protein LOC132203158 isoform X2 [Neocloeon triangulifer]